MASKEKKTDPWAVETWPIDKFIPYAGNPRDFKDAVPKVAGAIKRFGFRVPIVVKSDGEVVDGHLRLEAAKSLGMTELPVMLADDMTDAEIKAFRLSVNKVAELADWDIDMLKTELEGLVELDFDLSDIGFDMSELDKLLEEKTEGKTDPDAEVPPPPAAPAVVPGETYILGRHRLRCGDSTSADDVGALLGDVKPHLMVTDPPYGVEYDPKWRAEAGVSNNEDKMGVVQNDDRADWAEAWALFPGDVAYVWHAGLFTGVVGDSLEKCGFTLRSQIIWAKDRFALSRGDYHWHHEPCWYAVKKSGKGHWGGDRKQSTIWNIPAREDKGHGHGTQKPVECMRRPIVNNSSEGQAIYEPFCGSGTTIIACEMEGRHCFAMELDPGYVQIIIERWQEFTGEHATRESDGKMYNEIKEEVDGGQ